MTGLLQFINELGYRDIAFKSLCEKIELSSEENCKFITVFNAIRPHVNQNFESDGWRKLATKRAEGRMGQRHKTLDSQITKEIQSFLSQPLIPVADIAKRYNISRATIYSTLIKGVTGITETPSTV
jgi:DNA invertase Pin-like site-specific DNA recombinase